MLKKLLLLLLAPSAATTAALVSADVQESVTPRSEIVSETPEKEAEPRRSRLSEFFSPVARVIESLRENFDSVPSTFGLEIEDDEVFAAQCFLEEPAQVCQVPTGPVVGELWHGFFTQSISPAEQFARTVCFRL